MKTAATVLLFALLAACSATPRTSTADEREVAYGLLATAEAALEIAIAAGAVEPDDVKPAREDIAAVRKLVDDSAAVPVTWSTILARATTLSVRWIAAKG
jgi:hypothetical protein